MSTHRIRIFSSLLIAFIIVSFYGRLSTTPFISPIEADSIKNLLSNIKFYPSDLKKLFSLNIKFPESSDLKPLTKYNGNVNLTQISSIPTPTSGSDDSFDFAQDKPTPTNRFYPVPTSNTGLINQTPTNRLNPTRPIQPTLTTRPKPTVTKYIKPTKVPPLPPVTSDLRPGTTLRSVFEEVSKRACIPTALLLAFQTEESGAFFNPNNPASTIKIYNTYGWWTTGAGNSCFGLGYNTATGIVPSDSNMAGTRCQNGVGGADLKIMGVLQISEEEQTLTRKYTIKTLPNNIDRRVLFDNALIFAIATNNRIGTTPKNCNDWTDDEVQLAAEKHYGSCYISATRNYCNEVLKLYKQYR